MMVFRSATLGYYDLLSPKGVIDYGGLRPGCWINGMPAGGCRFDVITVGGEGSRHQLEHLRGAFETPQRWGM